MGLIGFGVEGFGIRVKNPSKGLFRGSYGSIVGVNRQDPRSLYYSSYAGRIYIYMYMYVYLSIYIYIVGGH